MPTMPWTSPLSMRKPFRGRATESKVKRDCRTVTDQKRQGKWSVSPTDKSPTRVWPIALQP